MNSSPSGLSPLSFELWISKANLKHAGPSSATKASFDYYGVLGVEPTASGEEIRRAFRQQAMRWHPDKVAAEHKEAATERFKELGAAYEVLSDGAKRQEYDVARSAAEAEGKPMPGSACTLGKAWEIFIRFMVTACTRQYQLSSGPVAVLRFISTCGVAAVMSMGGREGQSAGLAMAALAAALLNSEGVLDVYRALGEEEKVAFSNAVLVIARQVME